MSCAVSPRLATSQFPDSHRSLPSTAIENSKVTFTCTCIAYPDANVRWEKSVVPEPNENDWKSVVWPQEQMVTLVDGSMQVNSTLPLIARPDVLGHLFRCICWCGSNVLPSDPFQLFYRCIDFIISLMFQYLDRTIHTLLFMYTSNIMIAFTLS